MLPNLFLAPKLIHDYPLCCPIILHFSKVKLMLVLKQSFQEIHSFTPSFSVHKLRLQDLAIFDHLPPSSSKHSLWTAPKTMYQPKAQWNLSSFEFRFDDTSLAETAYRAETEQRQDATISFFNWANLILILWGKSRIIKFEFKTS